MIYRMTKETVAEMAQRHRRGCGNSFYGEMEQLARTLERERDTAIMEGLVQALKIEELEQTIKLLTERLAEMQTELDARESRAEMGLHVHPDSERQDVTFSITRRNNRLTVGVVKIKEQQP